MVSWTRTCHSAIPRQHAASSCALRYPAHHESGSCVGFEHSECPTFYTKGFFVQLNSATRKQHVKGFGERFFVVFYQHMQAVRTFLSGLRFRRVRLSQKLLSRLPPKLVTIWNFCLIKGFIRPHQCIKQGQPDSIMTAGLIWDALSKAVRRRRFELGSAKLPPVQVCFRTMPGGGGSASHSSKKNMEREMG